MDPKWSNFAICLYIYSHYNTDWIDNTEIVLDPNNSVIKRFRCTTFVWRNEINYCELHKEIIMKFYIRQRKHRNLHEDCTKIKSFKYKAINYVLNGQKNTVLLENILKITKFM